MTMLTNNQWRELDEVILEISALPDLAALTDYLLHRLPRFLGCHFASWNEHDSQLYLTKVRSSETHEHEVQKMMPVLHRVMPSHPIFPLYIEMETGKVRFVEVVERMREHISDEDYHASPYYQELAAKFGIEDQLLMHVAIRNHRGIVITFHSESVISTDIHLQACVLRGHILVKLHALESRSILAGRDAEETISRLRQSLTSREYEVLRWVCTGNSNVEIAILLGISKRTVDKHLEHILQRLNEESRARVIARYGAYVTNSSSK